MESILEGNILGQKHRNYNNLVKATAADETYELSELDYNESDIHNMLRIDVACIRRQVKYLLEVLKSQDMLYVHRAVNGSVWLVTEERYSYIINPEYLSKELFPKMMNKAKNKLLSSIRNNLRDATRAEAFFEYYYKDNFAVAQHWLRHCSIDFIEDIVVKHADKISSNVIKHLCRKSSKILKCYLNCNLHENHPSHRCLFRAKPEEAVEILDLICTNNQEKPNFRKRFTRSLMKRYHDEIVINFHKYYAGIHMPTFAKYLDKEKIENLLLKSITNDHMKEFIKYDNLKYFLRYMPEINRLQLIEVILQGTGSNPSYVRAQSLEDLKIILGYKAYEFVTFDRALFELKDVIFKESSPCKRNSILSVLVYSARGDNQHIQTLLEYYRTYLMEEPADNKVKFLNKLLPPNSIHRFNSHIWSILEDIIMSINLSDDTCTDGSGCFETMTVYKLIHDEIIPEAFKKIVQYKSFLGFRHYLHAIEQRKVLDYVYEKCLMPTCKRDIANEEDMHENLDMLKNILVFLKDWNKGPDDYPVVMIKIREIIKIKAVNNWDIDLSSLYHANKLFRKELFDESLVLCFSDETSVHVLKYDPDMLFRRRDELVIKCASNLVSLKRTLSKLRVYSSASTIQQWIDSFFKLLHQSIGQKTIVESLCILLRHKEAMSILIEKYAPDSDCQRSEDGLRQNIANCLHLVRPVVDIKVILMYAKAEYLRYLISSVNIILRNQSSSEFWSSIFLFLTHKPLCKYSARLAYSMVKTNKSDSYYKINKLPIIKNLRYLLSKEENVSTALVIWDLLIKVYDDMLPDERDKAPITMYIIYEVRKPIKIISFKKLYHIYKLYGPKCQYAEEFMIGIAGDLYDRLDISFVENDMVQYATKYIFSDSGYIESTNLLAKYILNCDCENKQVERYEKILFPIMNRCFASWDTSRRCDSWPCNSSCTKHNIYKILSNFLDNIYTSITQSKCIIPVQICSLIKNKVEMECNVEEDLNVIITWNLNFIFLEKLKNHVELVGKVGSDNESNDEWNRICLGIVNNVAQDWSQYYKPILSNCGSLFVFVSRSCLNIFESLRLGIKFKLFFVKWLLTENNDFLLYCIAIDILRHVYLYNGSQEKNLNDENMRKELIEIIRSHPSVEVQIYYNHYESLYLTL